MCFMRELNEIKAEILLRSEKRIKQRNKTRRMIISFCVPLCLIVFIGSAVLVPALHKDSKNINDEGIKGVVDDGADGIVNSGPIYRPDVEPVSPKSTVSVIKCTDGEEKTVCVFMDPLEAKEINETLSALLYSNNSHTTTDDFVGNAKSISHYLIVYTDECGEVTVYKLEENILFDTNGKSVMLGEEEEKKLYSSFGIG